MHASMWGAGLEAPAGSRQGPGHLYPSAPRDIHIRAVIMMQRAPKDYELCSYGLQV